MSAAERQREFKARQRQAGLVRVEVWVPPGKRDAIKQAARDLVDDTPSDPLPRP